MTISAAQSDAVTRAVPPSVRLVRPPFRVLMTLDAVGGVWRYAMELARGLSGQGVEVIFAGSGPAPTSEQRQEALALGKLEWLDAPLDWMAQDQNDFAAGSAALPKLVRRYEPDVAHLNLPTQAPLLAGEVPIVVVSHSCLPTWWRTMRSEALPEEWRWHWRANRQGFDAADAVVAPSAAHADQLASCYGALPRLAIVHNGIAGVLHGKPKQDYVFAAGRWWDEGKNGRLLDEAARSVPWPVMMAGSTTGPASQQTALHHAKPLGSLPHRDVLGHACRAGILVSPSLYEPFGLAALEGARCGAALALADIPTYRELWRDAALLFDPRDADGLAQALRRLIGDEPLRRELCERALAVSRRYTPDRQACSMLDIYRSIAANRATPERLEA